MMDRISRLGEVFASVDGLYVNAEYRERPNYRFRHDAGCVTVERRYAEEITRRLTQLRILAVEERAAILDTGNEGCQYNLEILERFCRNAERHLGWR